MKGAFLPVRDWSAPVPEPMVTEELLVRSSDGRLLYDSEPFTGTLVKDDGGEIRAVSHTNGKPDERAPFGFLYHTHPEHYRIVSHARVNNGQFDVFDADAPTLLDSRPFTGTVVSVHRGRVESLGLIEEGEAYEHGSFRGDAMAWYTLRAERGTFSYIWRGGIGDSEYQSRIENRRTYVRLDHSGALTNLEVERCRLDEIPGRTAPIGCLQQLLAYQQLEGLALSSRLSLAGDGIDKRLLGALLTSTRGASVKTIALHHCTTLVTADVMEFIRSTGAGAINISDESPSIDRDALQNYVRRAFPAVTLTFR